MIAEKKVVKHHFNCVAAASLLVIVQKLKSSFGKSSSFQESTTDTATIAEST